MSHSLHLPASPNPVASHASLLICFYLQGLQSTPPLLHPLVALHHALPVHQLGVHSPHLLPALQSGLEGGQVAHASAVGVFGHGSGSPLLAAHLEAPLQSLANALMESQVIGCSNLLCIHSHTLQDVPSGPEVVFPTIHLPVLYLGSSSLCTSLCFRPVSNWQHKPAADTEEWSELCRREMYGREICGHGSYSAYLSVYISLYM